MKSTPSRSRRKAASKFPLWKHATGQWTKKVRGRFYYFGLDQDQALVEYLRVKDDLESGRTPKPFAGAKCTLTDLCNSFLTHKQHLRDAGEIEPRTFLDYYRSCELLLKHMGKGSEVEEIRPDDLLRFRRLLAKTRNPNTLSNEITRQRVILRFAFENGLIDRPVRFGEFKKPKKRVIRRQRASNGQRMFEAEEIRRMLDAADVHLRAMILLGVNCGFGNADVGQLPLEAVDLDSAVIDFPRPKTGINRRCPLWPETVAALRKAIERRHKPKYPDAEGKVFVTLRGRAWHRDGKNNPISRAFRRLLDSLELRTVGKGFYALRHVFETIGGDSRDQVAVNCLMGHADSSMADHYRERIDDERLQAVAEHVRAWLFGEEG